MNETEVMGAIDSITLCWQCVKQHPIELSEPLLMQNFLYNILYRAAKKVGSPTTFMNRHRKESLLSFNY